MHDYLKSIYLSVLMILFIMAAPYSAANTENGNDKVSSISKAMLQSKIDALNAREGLDNTLKSKTLAVFQNALDNLASIETFKAKAIGYEQAIKQAPDKTKALQKDIEQTELKIGKQPAMEAFNTIKSNELEQRLIIEKGKISNLDAQINKLQNDLIIQNGRSKQIRQESVAAQQDLDDNQKALQASAKGDASKVEAEAREIFLKTEVDAKTNELKMLEYEAISNPARVELLKSKLKLLGLQKIQLLPVISAIEALIAEHREQEARVLEDAFSQTEHELAGKPAAIQQITRQNIRYSRQLQAIAGKIDGYQVQKNRIDGLFNDLDSDFKGAEKKISLAGLSPALGKILREQRRNLPDREQYHQQTDALQNETALASLEEFKIEDQQKAIADSDRTLQNLMDSQVDPNLPSDQRLMIQAQLRILLDGQKELLEKLALSNANYLRTLGDYDFAQEKLLALAEKFAVFLDERLLWVPSSEPINGDYPATLFRSVRWFVSPNNWVQFIKDTFDTTQEFPLHFFVIAAVCLGLLLIGKWARRTLLQITLKVNSFTHDSFQLTVNAIALSFANVLPAPAVLFLFGKLLDSNSQASDFTAAIANGLMAAATPLLFLQYFKLIFAADGIASQHFYWSKQNVQLLAKQIGWLRFVSVPCMFLIASTSATKVTLHSDNLGRFALIINLLAISMFIARLLKPSSGLLKETLSNAPDGWLAKLCFLWYPGLFLAPIVVIGFAVAGYYLSALELLQKMIATLRWVFAAIFIHAVVFRWLSLVNRQLAIANAKQKYRARHQHEKHVAGSEDSVVVIDEHQVDIPKINAQTIHLLNVLIGFGLILGFGLIWKNILPAFSFLDQIVLWQHLALDANQQQSVQSVTLANLLLAGLYIFIMVVSVRNFSGVMELLLFRHLEVDAGSRYAVNQLARYSLVTISFIVVANELGGSWAQVQWLVAALGVGLGFGLQEIFANLVSGIILLFERPLRIGDTVTIGDVTSKVSRIQMRATTVIDWDHKELIVPNKTFITNQLVNWTLSSAITRVTVPVGVAYGSDLEATRQIIMDTVKATPYVLADPEPSVLCLDFGNSAINFTIYVFVNEFGNRLPVNHDLHIRIEKALREHNITIPFPQTDVHVRYVADKPNLGS